MERFVAVGCITMINSRNMRRAFQALKLWEKNRGGEGRGRRPKKKKDKQSGQDG